MTKSQVNSIARCLMATCALLLAGVSTQVDAQLPGPHPKYLQAIRDLRQARALLTTNFGIPAHAAAANAAIPQINEAIADLKSASHLDEKNLGEVPPPKAMPPEGRFHEVAALLGSAHDDIKMPESDPVAQPFKDKALGHIDSARAAIKPVA
jgi:hypothetical protein